MSRMAGADQYVGVTMPSAWFDAERHVHGDRPLWRMALGTHEQNSSRLRGRLSMGWRQVWGMFKRRSTDRSELVKTGQGDCQAEVPFTEGDEAIDGTARGSRMQDAMEDASQNELAEQHLDAVSEWGMQCEHNIQVLSLNRHPPDIYAFADYLREALPWGPFLFDFEKLYDHYIEHCALSNRRPMTPRQLQNEWKKVGHARRESSAVAPRRRCYFLQDDRTGAARVGKIPKERALRR